jgi:hypothetical protein
MALPGLLRAGAPVRAPAPLAAAPAATVYDYAYVGTYTPNGGCR